MHLSGKVYINTNKPMKNILLLFTKHSVDAGQSDPVALCDALNQAAAGAAQYEYAFYDQLEHYIFAEGAAIRLPDGRSLDAFDAVYQRRWSIMSVQAASVATFLSKKGVPFADSASANNRSSNKLVQHWRMWQHGLPFPNTVYIEPDYLADWLARHLADTFTLPCIMKSHQSQRGKDNYLVHTVEEAVQIATDNPGVPFMVQEFIENDGDYRVLVCGDAIGLVIRRTSADDTHKNNTSQGATAAIVPTSDLPAAVQAASLDIARIFGFEIAGVDVVFRNKSPQDFFFFEINNAPQIDHSSFTSEKAVVINQYFMQLTGGEK